MNKILDPETLKSKTFWCTIALAAWKGAVAYFAIPPEFIELGNTILYTLLGASAVDRSTKVIKAKK